MEKRTLICSCGQEMMVPASALGRRGLCPNCGTEVDITEANTTQAQTAPRPRGSGLLGKRQIATSTGVPREEASRRFATAVDLFNAERYAEALIVLDALLCDFPNNDHIESARNQCVEALRGPAQAPALTYEDEAVDETRLSLDLVKSVVLDKLVNARSDEVQLKAAELALQVLALERPPAPLPLALPDHQEPINGSNEPANRDPAPVTELPEPARKPRKSRRKTAPKKRKS
jgi:hypothetical protein